jgi:hypothetical protein
MIRLLYIARYQALAVLLLMLSALAPAIAQNVVYQTVVYQGETTELGVEQMPGDTYVWDIYNDSTVNFATATGTAVADGQVEFVSGNIGATVSVLWKTPGVYFYKVTAMDITGCTMNLRVGIVRVLPSLPTAVIEVNPLEICIGEWAELTVTFTGKAPWSFRLQEKDNDGTRVVEYSGVNDANNPYTIRINPSMTTEYTVIEVTDARAVQKKPSNSVILTVNPLPVSSPIYLKP